jgi:hypothetical protein
VVGMGGNFIYCLAPTYVEVELVRRVNFLNYRFLTGKAWFNKHCCVYGFRPSVR